MNNTILYSQTILDPKSRSVALHDTYFICKSINGRWHIIEGAVNDHRAFSARDVLANHDLKNGHIQRDNEYRVFKKGLNEIRTTLED